MDLSRTVSEINGDFNRKWQIFPTDPVYFAPPLTGFPLELSIGAWSQKPRLIGYMAKKFDDIIIFSRDRHRATAKTALTHSVAR